MNKACLLILAVMTLMPTPSCAQRNASSDYKYLKAIEAYRDEDDAPTGAVAEYAGKHYTYAVAKVKAEMNKENASGNWILLLTSLYENHGDYAKAIDLDKDYPYLFLSRGDQYKKQGETGLANADYEMVVAKDTVAEDGSCRHLHTGGAGWRCET